MCVFLTILTYSEQQRHIRYASRAIFMLFGNSAT